MHCPYCHQLRLDLLPNLVKSSPPGLLQRLAQRSEDVLPSQESVGEKIEAGLPLD